MAYTHHPERALGHASWRPDTSAFALGTRSGVTVIDPTCTRAYAGRALLFLAHLAHADGHVLFVCTRGGLQPLVTHIAHALGHSAVTSKWIGGTLTNWSQVQATKGELRAFPDALCVLNPYENTMAIMEARRMHIPVVAPVDTDTPLAGIEYAIPMNDDSEHATYALLQHTAQVMRHAPALVA